MQCYENGILSRDNLDGIDLRLGDPDAAIQMIHKITCRDGFGNVLAEGVSTRGGSVTGAERCAIRVKGQVRAQTTRQGQRGSGVCHLPDRRQPHGSRP